MIKQIRTFLRHALLTILLLAAIAIVIGIWQGASLHYGDHPSALDWTNDGPYVFIEEDNALSLSYIQGNQEDGYAVEEQSYPANSVITATCYFPLDSSSFSFRVQREFLSPESIYEDDQAILAISDIEGGYRAFRDFLIHSEVIDEGLNWTFGQGHLVLVGDVVDRGMSVTQVLWLIYKLEQDAAAQGGQVHLLIGNHELKAMQGNTTSASPKYYHIASILGRQEIELYQPHSVIGRWLSSKNAIERINGQLFVHGGIHPDVAASGMSLDALNRLIRENYYQAYYPKPHKSRTQLILSSKTGPCWYRGYFKDDLTQTEVESALSVFHADAVIVGHTVQWTVNRQYEGKVIGIDVKHPKDYHLNWPKQRSEGLLIEEGKYHRVLDNGEREEI